MGIEENDTVAIASLWLIRARFTLPSNVPALSIQLDLSLCLTSE